MRRSRRTGSSSRTRRSPRASPSPHRHAARPLSLSPPLPPLPQTSAASGRQWRTPHLTCEVTVTMSRRVVGAWAPWRSRLHWGPRCCVASAGVGWRCPRDVDGVGGAVGGRSGRDESLSRCIPWCCSSKWRCATGSHSGSGSTLLSARRCLWSMLRVPRRPASSWTSSASSSRASETYTKRALCTATSSRTTSSSTHRHRRSRSVTLAWRASCEQPAVMRTAWVRVASPLPGRAACGATHLPSKPSLAATARRQCRDRSSAHQGTHHPRVAHSALRRPTYSRPQSYCWSSSAHGLRR
mmetsp:Transcript_36531/g.91411  ORF Transcript_36531/g.91411 Transcript_36531/m.91411 type:complete len:297 (-) Transcript_36531:243-1133(-)